MFENGNKCFNVFNVVRRMKGQTENITSATERLTSLDNHVYPLRTLGDGRVRLIFSSPMLPSSTVAGDENIYFFGGDRMPIKFF